MAAALQSVNARLRNAPPNLPFLLNAETLRKGLNFTFITDVGDLDLLGEVRGIGCFEMVAEGAPSFEVLGYEFKVIALEKLILAKRTAGRAKDLLAVAELEAILESKNRMEKQ
jgi:predicted nucleotidyltransferase